MHVFHESAIRNLHESAVIRTAVCYLIEVCGRLLVDFLIDCSAERFSLFSFGRLDGSLMFGSFRMNAVVRSAL